MAIIDGNTKFLELLWVAPELIPQTVTPGNVATQKGDVYSFAIILEEIVIRGGPYEVARTIMSAQEVFTILLFIRSKNFFLHLMEAQIKIWNIRKFQTSILLI